MNEPMYERWPGVRHRRACNQVQPAREDAAPDPVVASPTPGIVQSAGELRELCEFLLEGCELWRGLEPGMDPRGIFLRHCEHPKEGRAQAQLPELCTPGFVRQFPLPCTERIDVQRPATALAGPDPARAVCRQVATEVN